MNSQVRACCVLSVLVFLCAGSLAFAQNAPPQPVEGLTVVDSTGKRVGNVVGFGAPFQIAVNHAVVAFRVNGTLAVVGVGPQGFVDIGSGNTIGLYFATADCTGDGYRAEEIIEPSLVPLSLARANKVYLESGSPQTVLIRSFFGDTSGLDCVPAEPEFVQPMIRMRLLTELSDAFTPPFTLR